MPNAEMQRGAVKSKCVLPRIYKVEERGQRYTPLFMTFF